MADLAPQDPVTAHLGAYTEARFQAAFAQEAVVYAAVAADLIGVDVRTLAAMTDDLVIRAVRRGKLRAYTERDLRIWMVEGETPAKREKDQCGKRSRQEGPRSRKVIPFSEMAQGKTAR